MGPGRDWALAALRRFGFLAWLAVLALGLAYVLTHGVVLWGRE